MNFAEFVSASALLKRNWFWVALLLLCALISYAVFVAPARIGRIELEREAKIAATRIGAQLQGEPGTLIDAFARPALAPHLNRIFEDLGYAHRVLRYEFYDAASNLTFTSGSTALRLAPEVEDVARGFPAAATAVTLHNGSNAAVSQFAVLTIPTR